MLRFRLSATLLLAVACSLMTAVVSVERAVACGRDVQRLSCDSGVIRVQTALYGRRDNVTCSAGRPQRLLASTHCSQRGIVDVLKRRCDGKKACELTSRLVHSPNSCRGIADYLETTYNCFPAHHLVTCEGSLAHLTCDVGQIIYVYGSHYGRRDGTTCSYLRPTSQISNFYCSSASAPSKVAESCNGRNSCTIQVGAPFFRDPCVGIYKYLEVAYICEYPLFIPNSRP